MIKRRKLLLVWGGRRGDTSNQLFEALSVSLSKHHDVRLRSNSIGHSSSLKKLVNNVWDNVSRLPDILWAHALVIHSYAALSLINVIVARLLFKRVVVFHWDVYPTTMRGQRRSGAMRYAADALERFTVKLATAVVIPSADFEGFVSHHRLVQIPLWPSIEMRPSDVDTARSGPLRVAFVGQLDISRGVEDFAAWAQQKCNDTIELHLFSSGQRLADRDNADNLRIIYHPRMARQELQKQISQMHLGLISLSKDLDQPGFPSKVFDYVAANVPVIYFGRPLPAFCELITSSGIGELIDSHNSDLTAIHERLMSNWGFSRSTFLYRTQMDVELVSRLF